MRFGILEVLKCWKMIVNHDIYSLPQRIKNFTPKVTRWIFYGIESKFRVRILNYSLLTIVFAFAFNIVEFNSMKISFINERELRLTRLTRCMWHSGKSHLANQRCIYIRITAIGENIWTWAKNRTPNLYTDFDLQMHLLRTVERATINSTTQVSGMFCHEKSLQDVRFNRVNIIWILQIHYNSYIGHILELDSNACDRDFAGVSLRFCLFSFGFVRNCLSF